MLHLFTCHGRIMPRLAELLFIYCYFDMHLFCVNFVSEISPELLYLET